MTKDRLYLFDTTLRDGAQTNGLDFSVEDKILIAGILDDLGVDYVEGAIRAPTRPMMLSFPRSGPRRLPLPHSE